MTVSRFRLALLVFMLAVSQNGLSTSPATAANTMSDAIAIEPVDQQASYELKREARLVARKFIVNIQAELVNAVQNGGSGELVDFCHGAAPKIASKLQQETGWVMGRTSLRVRNPLNAPDDWERDVLERFERHHSQGSPFSDLRHGEIVVTDHGPVYRYMEAILAMPACMRCHGHDIDSGIENAILQFYPQDRAQGFSPGEIRGALTIEKALP